MILPGATGAKPRAAAEEPAAGAKRSVAEGLDAAQAHRAVRGAVIVRHRSRRRTRLIKIAVMLGGLTPRCTLGTETHEQPGPFASAA